MSLWSSGCWSQREHRTVVSTALLGTPPHNHVVSLPSIMGEGSTLKMFTKEVLKLKLISNTQIHLGWEIISSPQHPWRPFYPRKWPPVTHLMWDTQSHKLQKGGLIPEKAYNTAEVGLLPTHTACSPPAPSNRKPLRGLLDVQMWVREEMVYRGHVTEHMVWLGTPALGEKVWETDPAKVTCR